MSKNILHPMSKTDFVKAFKVSIPVLFGYLALGIGLGILTVEKGYPFWLTPLMSIVMFAGAGQFVAIGLFSVNASLGAILLTEFLVNIRHIVYGLSLINRFSDTGKWKPYLIFALSDETYSILTSIEVPQTANKGSFFGTIAVLDQSYWFLGTTIGVVLGLILKTSTKIDFGGIDFALTALFAVLLVEQVLSSRNFIPSVIGTVTTLTCIVLWRCHILPDSNSILLASLSAGIVIIMLLKHSEIRNTENIRMN